MKRIRQSHIEEMIDHAKEHDPNECCGILAGIGEDITHIYRVKNSTPSPFRYVMDPKEQLEVIIVLLSLAYSQPSFSIRY